MAYENHPASQLFPMMEESDLVELARDIQEHGLIEPILLFDGKILDGRNRLLACERAQVEPRFETVTTTSAVMFVVSKNLHRRHLTASQRGAIGADMVPMLREEAEYRQRIHGGTAPGITMRNTPVGSDRSVSDGGTVREVAAKAVGVGQTTVGEAMAVRENDPELFEQIKEGKVSTTNAARRVRETKRQERNLNGKKARINAKATFRKMTTGIATIEGHCHGLKGLKINLILAICPPKEIGLWAAKANRCANKLREFAHNLKRDGNVE